MPTSQQAVESLFEVDGEEFYWAHCAVPDCPNMVCRRADDKFCFPHMPEWKQKAYLAMLDAEDRSR